MVRPKKQSKRMPARKKYKIERKVREHHRKVKKNSKLNGKRSSKKDPGVPNLFPFKEQVLKQMEERKEKEEEMKQRRKELRQKEVNKRRNLQTLQKDAEKRAQEFERKSALKAAGDDHGERKGQNIDNSLKAYYKEFKKVVDNSDVILEVLDARDPLGCRCKEAEQAVLAAGPNKKLVVVLNKIDLVPREVVSKWLKYLRNEFPALAFKASTQTQRENLSQSKVSMSKASGDLLQSSVCVGAATLMKLLGNYCRNKDIKTSITVGVIGFPNVGKSSLINSLKRCKTCQVGATPGMTKAMQEIQLDKHIKLLDSPGVIMDTGKSDAGLILRNCIKVENLDDPVSPVELILKRCRKEQVMSRYIVPDYKDAHDFLAHLSRRLGKLKKGGIPDINASAKTVLNDWNSGRITFYTHPPEDQYQPLSSQVVTQWGQEFDLESLLKEEEKELQGAGLSDVGADAMVIEPSAPVDSIGLQEEEMESGDEEDEQEEVEETMEDSEDDLKDGDEMTVSMDASSKNPKPVIPENKKTSEQTNDYNLQMNKDKKKLFKKKKKVAKKNEKKIDSLADLMSGNFSMKLAEDDAYSFDADFTMS